MVTAGSMLVQSMGFEGCFDEVGPGAAVEMFDHIPVRYAIVTTV